MSLKILLPEQSVERNSPKNLQGGDSRIFLHELRVTIPPTYLRVFPSIAVDGYGLLWKKGHALPFPESHLPRDGQFPALKQHLRDFLRGFQSRQTINVDLNLLLATDDHSNGYFHWLSDVLPRLELQPRGHLAVPVVHLFPYVLETLKAYPELQPILISKGQRLMAPSITQISPVAPTGNYRPEIMQAIRRRFLSYFARDVRFVGKKVWISRQRAPKRKIVNEVDLIPILEKHGWEIVFMEDLDFAAQVKLMAESVALGGLHGAGLTNMLFIPAGGSVLEIRFRGDAHNNCYFSLASAMEHDYWYLQADSVQGADTHAGNVRLDPSQLDRVLSEMEADAKA